jgi:hypothetical protein
MTTSDRCRIDPSRPCGACSAPGPDQCPYTYLLADLFTDDPDDHDNPDDHDDHGHLDDETDSSPVDRAGSREHEPV